MATSLTMLIACRILQGLAGGGLQPSSQGVLLDAFPPEKQGAAQTVFGVAALLAPVAESSPDARDHARKNPRPFDAIGLTLLAVVMCSWEILLSKGQEWDWF